MSQIGAYSSREATGVPCVARCMGGNLDPVISVRTQLCVDSGSPKSSQQKASIRKASWRRWHLSWLAESLGFREAERRLK